MKTSLVRSCPLGGASRPFPVRRQPVTPYAVARPSPSHRLRTHLLYTIVVPPLRTVTATTTHPADIYDLLYIHGARVTQLPGGEEGARSYSPKHNNACAHATVGRPSWTFRACIPFPVHVYELSIRFSTSPVQTPPNFFILSVRVLYVPYRLQAKIYVRFWNNQFVSDSGR